MGDPDEKIRVPAGYVNRLRHGWITLAIWAVVLTIVCVATPFVGTTTVAVVGGVSFVGLAGGLLLTLLR